ncbi:MAG: RnfABCDGE type electron transport complex subunit D [Bacteroidota bacterium]
MSNIFLTVSPSPHDFSSNSVRKIMFGVIIAMLPTLGVSVYFFGLDAIRVTLISVIACLATEWLIQRFLIKGRLSIIDGSAVITGMLLAFNVPSNLPWWIILIGAVVSIGIGKMSFGGLGNNPFNPAIVGRVFMLISFPVQMTSWPKISILNFSLADAVTGATPLGIIKEGLKNGQNYGDLLDQIHTTSSSPYLDWFIGGMSGSIGEISAAAILIGGIYMLIRRIISWHIPVAIFASIVAFSGILYYFDPAHFADPLFHLLTGGVMLGAVFMATDMVTSPITGKGKLIFGLGIGLITILIRVFGVYPEGVSFAILIMNALVPLINKGFKPGRFGEIIKAET